MTTWTNEIKESVTGELGKANQALAEARRKILRGDPAAAADKVVLAAAHKHKAIDEFPPITPGNGESLPVGGIFLGFEKKDRWMNIIFLGSSAVGFGTSRRDYLRMLQTILEMVEALRGLGWADTTHLDTLKAVIEKAMRYIRLRIDSTTPAGRRSWWRIMADIAAAQRKFIDQIYGDNTGKTSEIFLGLIAVDNRFGEIADFLLEWSDTLEAGGDVTGNVEYARNMLDGAKETKDELETKIGALKY